MSEAQVREFIMNYPGMPLVDASNPLPTRMLERISREGGRMGVVLDGKVCAAIVPLSDLELLEITDHGINVMHPALTQA